MVSWYLGNINHWFVPEQGTISFLERPILFPPHPCLTELIKPVLILTSITGEPDASNGREDERFHVCFLQALPAIRMGGSAEWFRRYKKNGSRVVCLLVCLPVGVPLFVVSVRLFHCACGFFHLGLFSKYSFSLNLLFSPLIFNFVR